jgi:hypothetical protein
LRNFSVTIAMAAEPLGEYRPLAAVAGDEI